MGKYSGEMFFQILEDGIDIENVKENFGAFAEESGNPDVNALRNAICKGVKESPFTRDESLEGIHGQRYT